MPIIKVKETESFDAALRRFKRLCEKAGIISEMRRHEFYEKPKWKRKRKLAQAVKRLLKKTSRRRPSSLSSSATTRSSGRYSNDER